MGEIQEIEDIYISKGYRGMKLKEALEKDIRYQKLLAKKKQKLKFNATKAEKEKYVLSTNDDFEILKICNILAKKKLSTEDKHLVLFIKTQLEADWRKPIMAELSRLKKKYRIKSEFV